MLLRSRFRIRKLSRRLIRTARLIGPTLAALAFAGAANVAHAQGTMDFSGDRRLWERSKLSPFMPALSSASAG